MLKATDIMTSAKTDGRASTLTVVNEFELVSVIDGVTSAVPLPIPINTIPSPAKFADVKEQETVYCAPGLGPIQLFFWMMIYPARQGNASINKSNNG